MSTTWILDAIDTRDKEIKRLRDRVDLLEASLPDDVWYWQEDGGNDLDSLTCPVVINAETLRDLLRDANQNASDE